MSPDVLQLLSGLLHHTTYTVTGDDIETQAELITRAKKELAEAISDAARVENLAET